MVLGGPFTSREFAAAAAAGGACAAATHAAVIPLDVVKTRKQLAAPAPGSGRAAVASLSTAGALRAVARAEGASALLAGAGATLLGYALQGAVKFGGAEFLKGRMAALAGSPEAAWRHRSAIYLASAAAAEGAASLLLCPLEALRIRAVADASFPSSVAAGALRVARSERGGLLALYGGLAPLLLKQVPYTTVQFAVHGRVEELVIERRDAGAHGAAGGGLAELGVSLLSGAAAGVAAAVASHPADTLLSKFNAEAAAGAGKGAGSGAGAGVSAGAGAGVSVSARLARIVREVGPLRLLTVGLGTRCIMVGAMSALQFAIFDGALALSERAFGGRGRFRFAGPDEIARGGGGRAVGGQARAGQAGTRV